MKKPYDYIYSDDSGKFLNVDELVPDCKASYPAAQQSP